MKKSVWIVGSLFCFLSTVKAQKNSGISLENIMRVEKTLSADDMEGRKTFTPGIDKAAAFIAGEFGIAGLKMLTGAEGYLQKFALYKTKFISAIGEINGTQIDERDIIFFGTDSSINITEKSPNIKVSSISAGKNLMQEAYQNLSDNIAALVLVDESFRNDFAKLKRFKRESFALSPVVFVLVKNAEAARFSFALRQEVTTKPLANVAGMLPGKSKPGEFVVFSGHYDHLGIGKADASGDSIYNGANDDAAGTTAVIELARYFSAEKNNARTLIFVAFTAEEIGGFGSQYFSKQLNPDSVVAMFNIEMIGTQSKWGTNSAYITGFEKSDFGPLLQKNLKGSAFQFHPDPYPQQNLFYRSDNATLAALGVPAHTISTSQMDDEKNYHMASDEFETLDIKNMAAIIEAIALSSKSIVSGADTPARVEKANK